jgi:GNAT superfamily N-acetyltransferase
LAFDEAAQESIMPNRPPFLPSLSSRDAAVERTPHGADDEPRIELSDGRSVLLMPVRPADSEAERDFVGALSMASRYRRFHFGIRELTPEASRAMTEIDQYHHVAFVARPADAVAGAHAATIVADARYVVRADSADAEFAIAVADAWQGAGLGRELLLRLAAHARAHSVRRLFGDVLWGNGPMLGLVRKLGATLARRPGDATVVRAEFVLDSMGELAAAAATRHA